MFTTFDKQRSAQDYGRRDPALKFEALKMGRVTTKFERLDNVTTVAEIDVATSADLAEIVPRIMRENIVRPAELTQRSDDVRHGWAIQEEPAFPKRCTRFN